jgi:hypothetical protein
MAGGGRLPGFGGGDRRLTLLEDGEFVVNKWSTAANQHLLQQINGSTQAFQGVIAGAQASAAEGAAQMASGGSVSAGAGQVMTCAYRAMTEQKMK